MNTFFLRILKADEAFFQGECLSLSIPLSDGQYGILAGHSNMVGAIVPGALRYQPPGEPPRTAAVSHGLIKVENNQVLLLVESVERPEEIDTIRAQKAAQRATELLKEKHSQREFEAAQAALSRNLNRLHIKNTAEK